MNRTQLGAAAAAADPLSRRFQASLARRLEDNPVSYNGDPVARRQSSESDRLKAQLELARAKFPAPIVSRNRNNRK